MAKAHVPAALRRRIEDAAGHRCGYCRTPSSICGAAMQVEHIIPEGRGGATVESNLWLACVSCNGHKADRLEAHDPQTGEEALLFDPRTQAWQDHFAWSSDGSQIEGRTHPGVPRWRHCSSTVPDWLMHVPSGSRRDGGRPRSDPRPATPPSERTSPCRN